MKKILVLVFSFIFLAFAINVSGSEVKIPSTSSSGDYITYFNGEYVTIPTEYTQKENEFRGVWVSTFVGDIPTYTSIDSFKAEATKMLDILEYYNFNTLIFHIRTHNNALYKSSYNPVASWWRNVDFDEFDPLEWLIDETHKRGMEFHAWMNPYRVNSSYYGEALPKSNPASDEDNLLYGSLTILNPAKEKVKSFLVQTCMEVVKNYDVDAIHFDDYFYCNGIGDSDDSDFYADNPDGLSKADWRRSQIDDFIRRLSNQIKKYNEQNNKCVQLGISPTGTYQNGNGVVTYDENGNAVTNGSLTNNSQSHYGDHLYCDTKKWVDNEWIDYILPQCYNGMEEKYFAGWVDWWDAVVKNKKVNLYIGVGFYLSNSAWSREDELINQLYFMNKHENVDGFALYRFTELKQAYNKTNKLKEKQITSAYDLTLKNKTLPATLKRYNSSASKVEDVNVYKINNQYYLSFLKMSDNKFYVLYKEKDGVKSIDRICGGEVELDRVVISLNNYDENYEYSIVPLSQNNSLGEETKINFNNLSYRVEFVNENLELLDIKYTNSGTIEKPNITAPSDKIIEYSKNFDNISENTQIIVYFKESKRNVTFVYIDENYDKVETIKEIEGEIKFPVVPSVYGYEFKEFILKGDNYYEASYEIKKCKVTFVDGDGNTILEKEVNIGEEISEFPSVSEKEGYIFIGWSFKGKVKEDVTIKAQYERIIVKVTFKNTSGEVLDIKEVLYGENVEMLSKVEGYKIEGFSLNGEEITSLENLKEDVEVIVTLSKNSGCNSNSIQMVFYLLSIFGVLFVIKRKKLI